MWSIKYISIIRVSFKSTLSSKNKSAFCGEYNSMDNGYPIYRGGNLGKISLFCIFFLLFSIVKTNEIRANVTKKEHYKSKKRYLFLIFFSQVKTKVLPESSLLDRMWKHNTNKNILHCG